jgi:copper(I)-binding protein
MKAPIAALLWVLASTGAASPGSVSIVVSDAWSRPATGTAVVYATVRNTASVPDTLVGGSSPVATQVELHESSEEKGQGKPMMMGNVAMPMGNTMMSMKTVSSIPVPAHGSVSLHPGGYHLMLDLRRDVRAGEVLPLRLHFAHAGWIATNVRVRPI